MSEAETSPGVATGLRTAGGEAPGGMMVRKTSRNTRNQRLDDLSDVAPVLLLGSGSEV